MPDTAKLLDDILAGRKQPQAQPVVKPLDDLTAFAQDRGATITSTTGGQHNPGSLHGQGRAIDVRTKDRTDDEVRKLMQEATARGYRVRDERMRPAGQAVWGGPHLHLEHQGRTRSVSDTLDNILGISPAQKTQQTKPAGDGSVHMDVGGQALKPTGPDTGGVRIKGATPFDPAGYNFGEDLQKGLDRVQGEFKPLDAKVAQLRDARNAQPQPQDIHKLKVNLPAERAALKRVQPVRPRPLLADQIENPEPGVRTLEAQDAESAFNAQVAQKRNEMAQQSMPGRVLRNVGTGASQAIETMRNNAALAGAYEHPGVRAVREQNEQGLQAEAAADPSFSGGVTRGLAQGAVSMLPALPALVAAPALGAGGLAAGMLAAPGIAASADWRNPIAAGVQTLTAPIAGLGGNLATKAALPAIARLSSPTLRGLAAGGAEIGGSALTNMAQDALTQGITTGQVDPQQLMQAATVGAVLGAPGTIGAAQAGRAATRPAPVAAPEPAPMQRSGAQLPTQITKIPPAEVSQAEPARADGTRSSNATAPATTTERQGFVWGGEGIPRPDGYEVGYHKTPGARRPQRYYFDPSQLDTERAADIAAGGPGLTKEQKAAAKKQEAQAVKLQGKQQEVNALVTDADNALNMASESADPQERINALKLRESKLMDAHRRAQDPQQRADLLAQAQEAQALWQRADAGVKNRATQEKLTARQTEQQQKQAVRDAQMRQKSQASAEKQQIASTLRETHVEGVSRAGMAEVQAFNDAINSANPNAREVGLHGQNAIDALGKMASNAIGEEQIHLNNLRNEVRQRMQGYFAGQKQAAKSTPAPKAPTLVADKPLTPEAPVRKPVAAPEPAPIAQPAPVAEAAPNVPESPIDIRARRREQTPKGEWGKFSEAARKDIDLPDGSKTIALAAHPELRQILDLPEMPDYKSAPKDWTAGTQHTLDALADLAGVERSSRMNRETLRGAYARMTQRAKEKGITVSESLKDSFRQTVAKATQAEEGYGRFITNEEVQAAIREIEQAPPDRKRSAEIRKLFESKAAEAGLSANYGKNLYDTAVREAPGRRELRGARIQTNAGAGDAGNVPVKDNEKTLIMPPSSVDTDMIRPSIKDGKVLYSATSAEKGILLPREVRNYNSLGSWFTSSEEAMRELYHDNPTPKGNTVGQTYRVKEGNLLEAPDTDFEKFFGNNIPLIEKHFGGKSAKTLALRPDSEDARSIRRRAMNNPQYMQEWKELIKSAGYDGVVWKDSRIDAPRSVAKHDVYLIFHDNPISPESPRKAEFNKRGKLGRGGKETGAVLNPAELLRRKPREKVNIPDDFDITNFLKKTDKHVSGQKDKATGDIKGELPEKLYPEYERLTDAMLDAYDADDGARFNRTQEELMKFVAKNTRTGKDRIAEGFGLSRSLVFLGDLALMRNSMNQLGRNPKQYARNVERSLSTLIGSRDEYDYQVAKLKARPVLKRATENGVFLQTDALQSLEFDPSRYDESFGTLVVEKLPGARNIERANRVSIDNTRLDIFEDLASEGTIKRLKLDEKGRAEYEKRAAKFTNAVTGRGNIGEGLARTGSFLTSARYMASFPDTINQGVRLYLASGKDVRVGRQVGQYIGGRIVVTMLASAAAGVIAGEGVRNMLNPDDQDFAKIRKGDTTVDISGGSGGYWRYAGRLMQIAKNDSPAGAKARQMGKETWDLIHNRMAPIPRALVDSLMGDSRKDESDTAGRTMADIGAGIASVLTPIPVKTVAETAANTEGPLWKGLAKGAGIAALEGTGVNIDDSPRRREALPALGNTRLGEELRRRDINPYRRPAGLFSQGRAEVYPLRDLKREGKVETSPVLNRLMGQAKPPLESAESYQGRQQIANDLYGRLGDAMLNSPKFQNAGGEQQDKALTSLARSITEYSLKQKGPKPNISEILKDALKSAKPQKSKYTPEIERVRNPK